jgi:hypothetical protein
VLILSVIREKERTMRKVIDVLDDDQREALVEVVDLGIAMCSAGLVVGLLKLVVDLLTGP